MFTGFAGFHFAEINFACVRFVGKFFEDVGVNGGADEVVVAGMSDAFEAEVGVAFDNAGSVARVKADGNVDESARLKDFALQAFRRNGAGAQEVRTESSLSGSWLRLTRRKGDTGLVLLKGAEVVL